MNVTYRYAAAQKPILFLFLISVAVVRTVLAQAPDRPSETFARMECMGYVPPFMEPTPIPVKREPWFTDKWLGRERYGSRKN